ncbi:MAG: protein phosphatase 2C domain-containing protein [Alphaproteobacteria bacterium]|nr:protein phosphatase 2C domain-containing protein [Alphaproteobacteria bacterium]
MKNNLKPKIIATSVAGAHHTNLKQSCQDYNCHKIGKNLVAVVSDGAGSAKFGKTGAKIICETLCDILKNADFKNIKKYVLSAINSAREKLIIHRRNTYKSEQGIEDFAATLVGVVYKNGQGIFFHIGDGAAIAFKNNYNDFIISRPENGDFSCETFFYTQHEWKENLRFTHFEKASTIILMSDGVTNFSFSDDFNKLEHNFITPIDVFLKNTPSKSKAIKALTNTLKNPKAQKINPDDKTLVWIKVM